LTGLLSVVEADEVMTEMTVAKIRSVGSISISPGQTDRLYAFCAEARLHRR
jgi:hypothetical protein